MFGLFKRRDEPRAQEPQPDGADDRALVERARRGDGEAFGELYERHLPRVYRYIAYRTIRQDVAEDLAAEVFLHAWKAIGRYQDRGYSVRAWLLRMAHNEVVDYYRVRRDEAPLLDGELLPMLSGPELSAETGAERARLLKAIRKLPQEWQQLILLRFVEELSFEEIGAILSKRSGACRQMQHRALARLREVLSAEEVGYEV